jgi:hypothetical protein
MAQAAPACFVLATDQAAGVRLDPEVAVGSEIEPVDDLGDDLVQIVVPKIHRHAAEGLIGPPAGVRVGHSSTLGEP